MYLPKEAQRRLTRSLVVYFVIVVAAILVSLSIEEEMAPTAAPIYQGPAGKQQVALAINVDWGEEYLPDMLAILRERNVKATFFLTGRWTEKFPAAAQTIVDADMEIGNHGLKHTSPNSMSYEENVADIEEAARIIEDVLQVETTLFAPAAGEIGEQVLRAAEDLNYQVILWTADTVDWQKPAPETMVARVEKKLADGAIILMHPTENTVIALPAILDLAAAAGYDVVPVSQVIQENL